MPTLGQDLVRLNQLKDKATQLNAAAKKAAEVRDRHQAHCFARMEREDTQSMNTRGKNFIRMSTVHATMQDRTLFLAWARENEPDLVVEKEGSKTDLSSLVRRCIDDGEALPPGLGFYTNDVVSVRKAS